MDEDRDFHTFRGYSLKDAKRKNSLSASMEDYVEMIYRLSLEDSYTRVLELADALNVQPPSASRMLRRLADEGLVKYEKYSIVKLTPQGNEIGAYLLNRHHVLEEFLTLLGVPDVLEDAERIEHNISAAAMSGISELLAFFNENEEALAAWKEHLSRAR
ncbi:MAG: metal-dependent transcriptional regulator [Bacillota bacterium]